MFAAVLTASALFALIDAQVFQKIIVRASVSSKESEFVDITEKVRNNKSKVDSSGMPSEVELVDEKATQKTLALYSYMKNIAESGKILFGQQNGNDEHVTARSGVTSDVKDITGSMPAIVGIDMLAIAGDSKSNRGKNTEETLKYAVEKGKEAINNGAIITLSMHTPNMASDSIRKKKDGTYDFWACSFADSQNTGGDCAEKCLPGGEYNDRYNAYLDIAAKYIEELGDVPVLFRPLHESSGNWFWWGVGNTDAETYKALFRYTKDYMTQVKDIHNLIYVFSPGGTSDEDEYLQTYPGDEYVDILGFDSYDSNEVPFNKTFTESSLKGYCDTVAKLAKKKNKLAAISETGSLLKVKDCAIKGQDWYRKVFSTAVDSGIAYGLLWSNYDESNFYVPFKYNDTKGHEVINDFIRFYNEDYSVFANESYFYEYAENTNVKNINKGVQEGYFVNIHSKISIKNALSIKAKCSNSSNVSVVFENSEDNKKISVKAENVGKIYEAKISGNMLKDLGKTDKGKVELVADGKVLQSVSGISFNKDLPTYGKNMLENFEVYADDADLDTQYIHNGSGGFSKITLDKHDKSENVYSGSFTYSLSGENSYTGRFKTVDTDKLEDDVNAVTFWMKPDGHGEEGAKVILQIGTPDGNAEIDLVRFSAGNQAKYIVVPLKNFSKKISVKKITTLAFYRNNPSENAPEIKNSTIGFDEIRFVKTDIDALSLNEDGYAVLDKPLVTED